MSGPGPQEVRPSGTGRSVGEAIDQAVREGDAALAGRLVELMRFRFGMSYEQILSVVQRRNPGTTRAAWDALLREADELED